MPRKTGQRTKFQPRKLLLSLKKSWETRRTRYIFGIAIVVVILLLASLVVTKKNWFVVALVNNRPITSLELYQNLNKRYGKDVLDSIIQEKLINEEARKQKVTVSSADVDKRLKEIEDQLGGKEALDYALSSQGISLEQAKDQIKTQLIVEKILGKDIQVSDKEIDDFIKANPTAKDLSRDKIKEQIRSQKISQKFQTWIEDIKKKAKISKFI